MVRGVVIVKKKWINRGRSEGGKEWIISRFKIKDVKI